MHFALKSSLIKHSLFWWVLGNIVGVYLALLVVFPELNFHPFTYGRLMPLHLNFHLYGWCALPMIALLFFWYKPSNRNGQIAIWFWTLSLLFGGVSWLMGHNSGKLFLEWQGLAKNIFTSNLVFLWLVLVLAYLKQGLAFKHSSFFRAIFLLVLGAVPLVMNFAFRQDVFPPINTQSSGATGASLLISSLAVVGVFLLAPIILQLNSREKFSDFFIFLIIHFLAWLLFLDHGHSSQHQTSQIIGLSSMLLWIPLLFLYFRKFEWPETPWLKSFALWGVVLVFDAVITFLPGILEKAKFTNLLVAHVHIAMAGMTTSFAMLVLLYISEKPSVLNQKIDYQIWQFGLIMHLLSLFAIGFYESKSFYYLLSDSGDLMFIIRLLSGMLMTFASINLYRRSLNEI